MTEILVGIGLYLFAAYAFYSVIALERVKQGADFAAIQVVVAILWLPWLIWYVSSEILERLKQWRRK